MNDHFLPDIINKIGEYRSSLLFQPQHHIKAKRLALGRKNSWLRGNNIQKVNLLIEANNLGKDSGRKEKKYHYYSRKYCMTEPTEETNPQKLTL